MKVIDIHIHGGFGICFDEISTDKMKDFTKLAYEKGIAAFCPALTGDTKENLREKLKIIANSMKTQSKCEAKIIGANLEGTFLSKEKPGIQNPDLFIEPTVENFKKIASGLYDAVKIVVLAPENRNCTEFIEFLKSKDIKVHFGHTGTDSLKGADGICHLYNAMEAMTHKKETLAIKALLDKNVYTELIADGIHVTEDVLKLTFKIRPREKIILISDALPIAGSNLEYIEFCGKKIFKNGKDENNTLAGSVKLLPDIAESLIQKGLLDETSVHTMAYENPKNYLKLIV